MSKLEIIYITHWKQLKERKQYLTTRLKELGLFEKTLFMEKWDRNTTNSSEKHKYFKYNNTKDWYEHGNFKHFQLKKNSFRNLHDAEIYNFLNHFECFKHMIENDYEYALILEDDSILKNNFFMIDDILDQLEQQKDWDGVFFGNYMHKLTNFEKLEKVSKNLYKTGTSNTADSYMLSKKAVRKIVNNMEWPFVLPIDFEQNYWFQKYKMNIFWTMPSLINQGSFSVYKSSVDGPR